MTTDIKIALVTGAASGIGAASAKVLAQAGFAVGIHYNSSAAPAEALQKELPNSFLIQGDLSKSGDIDQIHDELKKRGGCDVLVNNAGFNVDAPLFSAKLEDFDQIIATNMRSTWYLTKKISRLMMRKRSGRIINISSVVGSTGNAGQTAYAMTKAAIDSFTKSAAMELAPFGVLVNSVAPGFIETKMTEVLSAEIKQQVLNRIPLQRMGRPEEVAQCVRFLAVEGTYCTGSVLHVNGGMYGG
jgi:3-oxoacyl-[acyl-carrier protein] reductase